jgi:hypothetical protein
MHCTSRPDCGCSFCVRTRKEPSPMADLERTAFLYIARLKAKRIRDARRNSHKPITHSHRGTLCEGCWDYENKKPKG